VTDLDIFVANEQDIALDEVRLSTLARHVLELEGVDESAELSVLFVSADHIRLLNARFAGDDYATDVLAFPMGEEDESALMLGDVVICPSVAEENSTKLGHALHEELDLLLVHGTLHLLGYDHQDEQETAAMKKRQGEIIESFAQAATQ
jgi:probable rRNA maturation factor